MAANNKGFVNFIGFHKGYYGWNYVSSGGAMLLMAGLCGVMGTMCSLLCCLENVVAVPINYILLTAFTACWTIVLSCVAARYDPVTVSLAICLCAGIVAALTLYACTTKSDMEYCIGIVVVLAMGVMMLSMMSMFMWAFSGSSYHRTYNIFYYLFALIGVVLMGIYLIFDIMLIMGGKHEGLEIDMYIIGAMILYMDVIYIFLYILKLLGGEGDGDDYEGM